MTTASALYGTTTNITITLAGLVSDANLLSGRQSSYIDNTADLAIDSLVHGKLSLGTGPTNQKQIEIWFYGSSDAQATGTGIQFSGGFSGVDGTASASGQAGGKTTLKLGTIVPTGGTSNTAYYFGPVSVAQAFGGVMPPRWGVFVVHNTGPQLNGTAGNFVMEYVPVKFSSA